MVDGEGTATSPNINIASHCALDTPPSASVGVSCVASVAHCTCYHP